MTGSLGLLGVALVAVVGLAKGVSPTIERGVSAAGLPNSVVGVVIAMLVLLPETIAAVKAALRTEAQTSLNLALGSAPASIGLTVPAVALATLIVIPKRATPLQGEVHPTLLGAYLVLAISP